MKRLMPEASKFFKNHWACAVTLYLFVRFGKCVFGRQLPMYLKKSYWLTNSFRLKVLWWGNSKNQVGGKEMEFLHFERH